MALPGPAAADWPIGRHDVRRTGQAAGTSDITEPVAYWKRYLGGDLADAGAMIADVDADGEAEVVMIAGGSAVAKSRGDEALWVSEALDLISIVGLADLDGQGGNELVVRSSDRAYVLDSATGAIVWAEPAGEMGTIGGSRLGDLDGDGLPELVIIECGCCAVVGPNDGYAYSFAAGAGSPVALWAFPSSACGGGDALTLVEADGTPGYEVLIGVSARLRLLDGGSGALLGETQSLGTFLQRSRCVPIDIDGIAGDELVCIHSTSLGAGANPRRVFALAYQPLSTPALQQLWSNTVAPGAGGETRFVELAADLDGDGLPEAMVAATDDGATWDTFVFDAATGAALGIIPDEIVLGTAPGPAGAVLLASTETHLSGWHLDRTAVPALGQRWTILDAIVPRTFDPAAAARSSINGRAAVARVNGDAAADLVTTSRSDTGLLIAYDLQASAPAELARHDLPAGVVAARMWPVEQPTAADLRLAVARNDGFLGLFTTDLTLARAGDDASAALLRTGGYYANGAWRRLENTPRIGRLVDGSPERIVVPDSRNTLLVLDAAEAGLLVPPRLLWEHPGGHSAAIVPGLDGARPGIACLVTDQPVTTPPTHSIAALDGAGAVLWSKPAPATPFNDVLPANLDGDAVPDLIFQWGDPGDLLLRTWALDGTDGGTLWEATPVNPGNGRQPAGFAVGAWDGDGRDDVIHQALATVVLSGANGGQLSASAAGPAYFLPTLIDADADPELEVLLHGGAQPVRLFEHDLASTLWLSADDNRPFPYGAIADCGTAGDVLVEGSYANPARLKLTATATGAESILVLAGGALYADESAVLSTSAIGQLTSATVHQNLTGLGRPSALLGSTDGWLYAIDPCAGTLDFTFRVGFAVGEAVYGDTDADGRDEILVSASDGFLYNLRNFEVAAPERAWEIDLADVSADIDEVETTGTLSLAWSPVADATGYQVAVADAGDAYVTDPAWVDAGSATTMTLTGLPLADAGFYRVAVRTVRDGRQSVDTASDGVIVQFPAGGDAGIGPDPPGGCCRAGGPGSPIILALLVVLGLWFRGRPWFAR